MTNPICRSSLKITPSAQEDGQEVTRCQLQVIVANDDGEDDVDDDGQKDRRERSSALFRVNVNIFSIL